MASKKTATKKAAAKKPAKKPINPVPRQYGTVTASLNQSDASATIAFCKKAFGAKVLSKMAGTGGKIMHSEILIGDTIVMVSDAVMEPARAAGLFLYVPKVDKTIAKAVKAGATVVMPAQDMFWGDRFGRVKDPFGNLWAVASRVEKVSPTEMKKRVKAEAKRVKAEAKAKAK
jgi:PhnB protein